MELMNSPDNLMLQMAFLIEQFNGPDEIEELQFSWDLADPPTRRSVSMPNVTLQTYSTVDELNIGLPSAQCRIYKL